MGLPITGQVCCPSLAIRMPAHGTYRNTILLLWLSISVLLTAMPDLAHILTNSMAGFFIWVFPTMYISQKLRIGKYLGANVVLWGIVMMLHAVPNSFGPFFALRILLGKSSLHGAGWTSVDHIIGTGMLESCVGPSLILIISMFYKKNEQVRPVTFLYYSKPLSPSTGYAHILVLFHGLYLPN